MHFVSVTCKRTPRCRRDSGRESDEYFAARPDPADGEHSLSTRVQQPLHARSISAGRFQIPGRLFPGDPPPPLLAFSSGILLAGRAAASGRLLARRAVSSSPSMNSRDRPKPSSRSLPLPPRSPSRPRQTHRRLSSVHRRRTSRDPPEYRHNARCDRWSKKR